jgi:hypothetical protein
MTPLVALRFLAVVLRPPVAVLASSLAVVAVGVYLAATSPQQVDQVFGLALLFQMFAAATGFTHRARRGHFDAVLTFPAKRTVVAMMHAAVSTFPGVATWMALAAIDTVASPGHQSTALTFAGAVALVYVSSVAWTATLRLPRYGAGLLWVLTLFLLAAAHRMHVLQETFLTDTATWANVWKVAGAAMVCPILLAGYPLAAGAPSVGVVLFAALAALAIGVWMVVSLDVALEDAS